jgi:isopenicillin N synthase-like dioxygenase
MLKYLAQVEALSYEFIRLLAEALGLKSDALADFFDDPANLQHRSKVRI